MGEGVISHPARPTSSFWNLESSIPLRESECSQIGFPLQACRLLGQYFPVAATVPEYEEENEATEQGSSWRTARPSNLILLGVAATVG